MPTSAYSCPLLALPLNDILFQQSYFECVIFDQIMNLTGGRHNRTKYRMLSFWADRNCTNLQNTLCIFFSAVPYIKCLLLTAHFESDTWPPPTSICPPPSNHFPLSSKLSTACWIVRNWESEKDINCQKHSNVIRDYMEQAHIITVSQRWCTVCLRKRQQLPQWPARLDNYKVSLQNMKRGEKQSSVDAIATQ